MQITTIPLATFSTNMGGENEYPDALHAAFGPIVPSQGLVRELPSRLRAFAYNLVVASAEGIIRGDGGDETFTGSFSYASHMSSDGAQGFTQAMAKAEANLSLNVYHTSTITGGSALGSFADLSGNPWATLTTAMTNQESYELHLGRLITSPIPGHVFHVGGLSGGPFVSMFDVYASKAALVTAQNRQINGLLSTHYGPVAFVGVLPRQA